MQARITYEAPTASGRRTGWAKTVEAVDYEARGARAFRGAYLRDHEQDMEVGTLVLQIAPQGSVKNGWEQATLWHVTPAGLEPLDGEVDYDWRRQFLSLRDRVATLLSQRSEQPVEPRDPRDCDYYDAACQCAERLAGGSDHGEDRDAIVRALCDAYETGVQHGGAS